MLNGSSVCDWFSVSRIHLGKIPIQNEFNMRLVNKELQHSGEISTEFSSYWTESGRQHDTERLHPFNTALVLLQNASSWKQTLYFNNRKSKRLKIHLKPAEPTLCSCLEPGSAQASC